MSNETPVFGETKDVWQCLGFIGPPHPDASALSAEEVQLELCLHVLVLDCDIGIELDFLTSDLYDE